MDNKKTPIETLLEVKNRIAHFCAQTDGTFNPPWVTEIYEMIEDTLKSSKYRNCDKYDTSESAFDTWRILAAIRPYGRMMPLFSDWLYMEPKDEEQKEVDRYYGRE